MTHFNLTTCSFIPTNEVQECIQNGHNIQSPSDWKKLEDIEYILNMIDQEFYMLVDNGANVLPRFDIIQKPKVGDPVSYAFNGDYREDGEIVKISKSLKVITTSTGNKYYRKDKTASWKREQTWTLVYGRKNVLNQEF